MKSYDHFITYHDPYAAWLGQCECRHCKPAPVYPETDDALERDDALEWGGVSPIDPDELESERR
jgi:hypothetical protein